MTYHIDSLTVSVRELPPDRMSFAIGSRPVKRRPRGVLVVRLDISDDRGRRAWGVSGDRPSFGWLDKRPAFGPDEKLARLFALVQQSCEIVLESTDFDAPFDHWLQCYRRIQRAGQAAGHEALTAAYASALFERAILDGVCRLQGLSLFEALKRERLRFEPERVFAELKGFDWKSYLPPRPRTRIGIRHTVGLTDPLTRDDLTPEDRVNDGEPETLREYIRRDGLRFFKVKISGDVESDLARLERVWNVLLDVNRPVVTLDGNESYRDLHGFTQFVETLESRLLGLFQHIAFIEQPLPRALTHDPSTRQQLKEIARRKPLVIDEADGDLEAFHDVFAIGYDGVSHKNCKGVFKSLINFCLCRYWAETTERVPFQSAEDLSNMPLVPLHQDFAAVGILDIPHCERNGHHYSYGLSHLTEREKQQVRKYHPDLYTERDGELFLRIVDGHVECGSLQGAGFGVAFEPDWSALTPLAEWDVKW